MFLSKSIGSHRRRGCVVDGIANNTDISNVCWNDEDDDADAEVQTVNTKKGRKGWEILTNEKTKLPTKETTKPASLGRSFCPSSRLRSNFPFDLIKKQTRSLWSEVLVSQGRRITRKFRWRRIIGGFPFRSFHGRPVLPSVIRCLDFPARYRLRRWTWLWDILRY